jgi:murein DD-endopeptidase MepM/ murein hydrolase activator NlpD
MPAPVGKHPISTIYGKKGKMWSLGRHTGVDYACPTGTKVLSTCKGVVKRAGVDKSYGNYVMIDTGERHVYFCHLSKISCKVNQPIKVGDALGLSGNTGNSSGPHLHYEERVKPFNFGSDKAPIYNS